MKQVIKLFILTGLVAMTCLSCLKDKSPAITDTIDYFAIPKPVNGLDSLIDTIQHTYGLRVIYKFDPRVIDPTTFFVPASYDKAKGYTKYVVEKMWLQPISIFAPDFAKNQIPIEFLTVGTAIHFNSISSGGAAGAGLNAQYYRLGMGDVNSFSINRAWIREHINILYHEHAHQLDHKFGRPKGYDQVSQGTYYDLQFQYKTDDQAQKDGFFRAYGGYQPVEDFATTVEAIMRFPKDSVMKIIAKNPKLEVKYKMVNAFYLSKGIDLHMMQVKLDSVVKALVP
ncbi:MAG TPA: putative zinc-binding metallopeptidase [Chitinophaga sp.]|uniref:putative zinc-binding metallopeptidase n=1 Tax=Chitinophaga sp. TaxID=1869181 RepID=UPI002BFF5F4D|nr:putative zinc-binding metallopeptidase [Chitinophaga sp.]HVI46345.1 putative zinc-binding metallopeptidase [Chitinophaga sp.]